MSSAKLENTNTIPSMSVSAVQVTLGNAIGALLSIGVMFVIFTSIGAAFVPGCPFRSPFSDAIRFISEKLLARIIDILIRRGPKLFALPLLEFGYIIFFLLVLFIAATASTIYGAPGTWFPFVSINLTLFVAIMAQGKAVHKPQKYKISSMAALLFLFFSLSILMIIFIELNHSQLNIGTASMMSIFSISFFGFIFAGKMIERMSKSMVDTGEIDAIAWLLITTPPLHPATFFKKAGQMTGVDSIGRHYRPRLLESLMPLLTPLITSYHPPEHHSSDTHSPQSEDVLNGGSQTSLSPANDDMVPIDEDPHSKDLEIYIACLARLSEFTDCKGTFMRLWEDAMQHPKLEQPVIDKLVELANPQRHSQVVRSAAIKVLNNYKLDMEGNPLRSPTVVLESVATDPRSETTSMLNDSDLNRQERGYLESYRLEDLAMHVEPAHSSEEVEEARREIGDEEIEENSLESPTTISGNVATDLRGETTLMLNDNWSNCQEQGCSELYRQVDRATHVEPAHSSEETEEVSVRLEMKRLKRPGARSEMNRLKRRGRGI